jgi:3-oxoacyl-[acyl-carrier-protein] synthase II
MSRVLVTGIGIVSPIGIGRERFWRNALEGTPGVRELFPGGPDSLPARIGGKVRDFDPEVQLEGVKWKRLSRVAQFALAAAFLAHEDAGLEEGDVVPERAGAAVGVGMVGMEMVERAVTDLRDSGPEHVQRYSAVGSYPGAGAANICIALNFHGESQTISTGCSASSNAIGYAWRSLREGEHDLMIAGGAEACLTPPVPAQRGAGHGQPAFRPGPRRLRAWGGRGHAGAGDVGTRPGPGRDPLRRGGGVRIHHRRLQHVSRGTGGEGCGPGHRQGVPFFGPGRFGRGFHLGPRASVSSLKSMIGHPLGACGGFQTAACALALRNGEMPPTINYENPDPDCDLDYVPNEAREGRVAAALNLSLGLGGNNAALALKAV